LTMPRIGTCSWKYDSWRGLVYSGDPNVNYLEEYSQKYNTVEIDQWFWSLHDGGNVTLPKPNVVEEYLRSVPEDFKFSIKIPNSITLSHFYRKKKEDPLVSNPHFLSVDLFNKFLERIQPLEKNLGPLMFQFEYLNKQKMSSQIEFLNKFETFISRCPGDYLYGMEIRNPNYMNESYFRFLNHNHLYHVFLQGYYMPPIFKVYERNASAIQNTVIIRLHGPDRKKIEEKSQGQWNQIYEPRDDELDSITPISIDLHETLSVSKDTVKTGFAKLRLVAS